MTIMRSKPPSRLAALLNHPAYFWHIEWRYRKDAERFSAKDPGESRAVIDRAISYGCHPGKVDWQSILAYPGAVYHTIKQVDSDKVVASFPHSPNGSLGIVDYVDPLTIGGQLAKFAVALGFMMFKTVAAGMVLLSGGDLAGSGLSYIATSKEFGEALTYLSLNAARSVTADLVAKAGPRPDTLKYKLGYIKIGKMTTSMLVTAAAFPLIYFVKKESPDWFGSGFDSKLLTAASICAVDGLVQFLTRQVRGYGAKVAFWDFWRPLVGDAMAFSIFNLTGLSWESHYLYLLTRKLFCELWTGHWESSTHRKEKREKRLEDFQRILNFEEYNVPDPQAAAAINLCYILSVKSLAHSAFLMLQRNDEGRPRYLRQISERLEQTMAAMCDDNRIKAAMDFQFPGGWAVYRQVYWEKFQKHRAYIAGNADPPLIIKN